MARTVFGSRRIPVRFVRFFDFDSRVKDFKLCIFRVACLNIIKIEPLRVRLLNFQVVSRRVFTTCYDSTDT